MKKIILTAIPVVLSLAAGAIIVIRRRNKKAQEYSAAQWD